MNIYVGNLATEASEEDLRQAFASFGEVSRATIIKDKANKNATANCFLFIYIVSPLKETTIIIIITMR